MCSEIQADSARNHRSHPPLIFKELRKHLPTKRVVIWMRFRRAGMMMRIDVAGALYRCAYQDSQKYYDGDYSVAWAHWQRLAQQLKRVRAVHRQDLLLH